MEKGEQIYKLPEGWIETSIDDLAVVLTGNTPPKKYSSYYGGNLPFYKPSDLNTGMVYRATEHLSDEGRAVARTLPKDSILVTSIGATIGKTGLIKKEGAFNQQINGIIPFVSFPLFYYYQILEGLFQRRIVENSSATTVPIINKSKFGKLKLKLAPLQEQHRIVIKIETLFSELDHAEKGLQNAKQQLYIYKQALLKSVFNGSITAKWRIENKEKSAYQELEDIKRIRKKRYNLEIQKGNRKKVKADYNITFKQDEEIPTWVSADLNNLIDINARIGWKGLTKKEYTTEGPLFLSVHSLNYGKNVVFKDANHITNLRYEESPEIKLHVNDILLCKDGAGIGKVGIIKSLPDKATVNSSLLVINAKEVFNPDFVYYFFLGPTIQKLVNEKISGSAIPHLFQKDIKKFNLKVPPKEEQNKIVDVLESRFTLVENLEKSITESLSNVIIFRHSILKKAFEGKLIEQNPNDEPAQILLQKIKNKKEVYIQSQRELEKLKPKKKKLMETKKTVLELLEEAESPISPQELWQKSIHEGDIESFYSEIKDIYSKLEEINKETEPLLILKK